MSLRTMAKSVVVLSVFGVALSAFAASFDCTDATSAVEKIICSDPAISLLDGRLQQAYKTALAATDSAGKKALTEEQRHWIRYQRNLCTDSACLQEAYTVRIKLLAANAKYIVDKSSCADIQGSKNCVNLVTYRDPNIRIPSFNNSLLDAKLAGTVIGCNRLINLPVGTAGGNNTYGGVCTLMDGSKRKLVEICNDDMIGRFQMQVATPGDVTEKQLVDFTYSCNGG